MRKKLTEAQWEQAKAMYLAGDSWKTIGIAFSRNPLHLRQRAYKEGLTSQKAAIAAVREQRAAERPQTIEENVDALAVLARQKLATDTVSTIDRVDKYTIGSLEEESKREQIMGSVTKRASTVFGWSDSTQAPTVNVALLSALPDLPR